MSAVTKRKAWMFFALILVASLGQAVLWYPAVYAQGHNQNLVHVCVIPNTEPSIKPYLLTFRDTRLFGLIVPHPSAYIVVYGSQGLWAKLYTIRPDVVSGGYRVLQNLAESEAQLGAVDPSKPRPCADMDAYRGVLDPPKDKPPSTIPLLVSSDRVVYIQTDGKNNLDVSALGVFSFVFDGVDKSRPPSGFQIVQLNGSDIDIRLLFVPQGSLFTLIANKEFTIKQSRGEKDQVFGSSKAPDPFSFLIDGYSKADDQKLFYQTLDKANIHIYPSYGFMSSGYNLKLSYLGGFIKVEHDPSPARRDPKLTTKGNVLKPITGAIPHYKVGSADQILDTVTVVRLDESTGDLIIRDKKDQEGIVEEPWLVEPTGKLNPEPTPAQ